MPDAVTAQLESLASTWTDEANRRRKMSAYDVTADVLEYCVSELRAELARATSADAELTPEAYALQHGVSASTVRRWCKSGRIVSRPVGREYRIRAGEPCPNLRARLN